MQETRGNFWILLLDQDDAPLERVARVGGDEGEYAEVAMVLLVDFGFCGIDHRAEAAFSVQYW